MLDPDHETTLQPIDRASLPQELSYDPLAESDIAHRVRVRHLTKMAELRIVEDARAEVATAANPRTDLFFKAEAIRDELQLLVDVYAVLENRHELKTWIRFVFDDVVDDIPPDATTYEFAKRICEWWDAMTAAIDAAGIKLS